MLLNKKEIFWSEKQLAERLNLSLSKIRRDRSLYGHNTEYLPWIKINGVVRYPVSQVMLWLESKGYKNPENTSKGTL